MSVQNIKQVFNFSFADFFHIVELFFSDNFVSPSQTHSS